MVEIETLYDPVAAAIVRGRLEAAGIAVVVLDAGIASMIGSGVSGVRVLVDAADEANARALLADFE